MIDNKSKLEKVQKEAIKERDDLASKIEDLFTFFSSSSFQDITEEDQFLMHIRLITMQTYERLLSKQIRNHVRNREIEEK